MLTPAFTGFATGFSLILAIGAQNAFVLRQGLIRQHVFWLALLCAVSDAILIIAGVLGFGFVVDAFPGLPSAMAIAGATFLFVYGGMRLFAAWRGDYTLVLGGKSAGLGVTLATCAALTWLNPHVYLDTLGLIGAISTHFEGVSARTSFAFGAVAASFVFFFGLAYGARLFAPMMQSASAWRKLDVAIALVMWLIAYKLLVS